MGWASRQVLVTGADGFIGSHLVEQLRAAGARVRALVQYNSFNRGAGSRSRRIPARRRRRRRRARRALLRWPAEASMSSSTWRR